jgi:hypothetical protein
MAKQDITVAGNSLPPGGIDDSMPIVQNALSFFRSQGMAINNGVAGRMTGKKLLVALDPNESIIAVHSDYRNAVWIETRYQLILITDFFHAFL